MLVAGVDCSTESTKVLLCRAEDGHVVAQASAPHTPGTEPPRAPYSPSAAAADPTGAVAGFADATGRYLPLVCTINVAGVLTATASLLGVGLTGLADLALAADAGAGGLTLLPLSGRRADARPAWRERRARRAAWALSGTPEPPSWPAAQPPAEYTGRPEPQVLARHRELRDVTSDWPAGASRP